MQSNCHNRNSQNVFSSFDSCLDAHLHHADDSHALFTLRKGHNSHKRQCIHKLAPIVFARVNTHAKIATPKTVKVLLDSGGSTTLIASRYTENLETVKLNNPTAFSTIAGTATTDSKVKLQFSLPEFHDDRIIEWNAHVAKQLGNYDMIIGRDLLEELGIDISFNRMECEWDESTIPMKSIDATPETSYHIRDEGPVDDVTARIRKILDAKYQKANIDDVIAVQKHLNNNQKVQLPEQAPRTI